MLSNAQGGARLGGWFGTFILKIWAKLKHFLRLSHLWPWKSWTSLGSPSRDGLGLTSGELRVYWPPLRPLVQVPEDGGVARVVMGLKRYTQRVENLCEGAFFLIDYLLKVSKSQKQFFLKLHCPKKNEILDKILPYEARAEFCQIFRSFFGQWIFKKKCFWDLLTFIN